MSTEIEALKARIAELEGDNFEGDDKRVCLSAQPHNWAAPYERWGKGKGTDQACMNCVRWASDNRSAR